MRFSYVTIRPMRRALFTFLVLLVALPNHSFGYTQIIAFGDSLTDTGNVYNQTFGISPQSPPYYNGRFSNGPLWLEDLATDLTLTAPTFSRGGGKDYAYGGAHTGSGSVSHFPFTFPNIGTQISSYLGGNTPNANQLFVVW